MIVGKSILTIGSVAFDDLEIRGISYPNTLGGSATYFSLAASVYTPVLLNAVVGRDFPQEHIQLFKSKGINLDNFQIKDGTTFHWGGGYSDDLANRETIFTELGVFEQFQPDIKNGEQFNGIVYLGNIQPELQLSVLEQVPNAETVIMDTMNLWIDSSPDLLWNVIAKTDIFLLNDEEAVQLTGKVNLSKAAKLLRESGPECVIIKQGEYGCLVTTELSNIHIPVFEGITAQDPTGAGDSFAGGFSGYLAVNGINRIIDAAIHGTAIASFTVSEIGVNGLLKANKESITKRVGLIRNKMEISVK